MVNPNELKFAEAWRALSEDTTKPGWNTLPITTSSNCLLLAGRHQPSNQESMLIGFTVSGLPKQSSLPQSKGFRLELVELPFKDVAISALRPQGIRRQAWRFQRDA